MKSLLLTSLLVAYCAAVSGATFHPMDGGVFHIDKADHASPDDPNRGMYYVHDGKADVSLATVDYRANMTEIGWDILTVTTHATREKDGKQIAVSDDEQAFAAGFAEGLTAQLSARQYYGNIYYDPNYVAPRNLEDWLDANDAWVKKMIKENPTSPYWYTMHLLYEQMEGVLAGLNYNISNTTKTFTYPMLRLLQTQGDQMDLTPALNCSGDEEGFSAPVSGGILNRVMHSLGDASHFKKTPIMNTHCSCLVGLAEDFSDVYFGHATWGTYNMMLRVFKNYHFSFSAAARLPGADASDYITVSFSSYPSVIVSIDDYYTTGHGLAVAETSFNTNNKSLYCDYVRNETVLYWMRVSAANRLAADGDVWTEMFGQHNSGTYNAQWVILDFKRFTPKEDMKPGTLWISEQFPGLYDRNDMTTTFASGGMWGSFNVPWNRTMFKLSGNEAQETIPGTGRLNMNSWELNVRARIWRRDASTVAAKNFSQFQFEMQYNDYLHDPISQGNPTYTIASRGDLSPGEYAACWGAIDAKATSYGMYHRKKEDIKKWYNITGGISAPSSVYNGPTPQVGPFEFSKATGGGCSKTGFPGLVNLYNFSWISVGW